MTPRPALRDVDLDLNPSAVHVVIGKSVLAHALLDLLPRNAGACCEPSAWRSSRGAPSALNPVRRFGPLLTELAQARGLDPAAAWPAVAAALSSLDLDPDRIHSSYPHHLSGGMA